MGITEYFKQLREDRMFIHAIFWFLCALFVVLRGGIAHLTKIEWFDFDVIVVLLVYLVAARRNFQALCLAFCMGLLTDIYSSSHLGLFAFVYSAIVLALNHSQQFLDLASGRTSALLVTVFILFKWCIVLAVLSILRFGQSLPSIDLMLVVISAFIMGLVSPILFRMLGLCCAKQNREHA